MAKIKLQHAGVEPGTYSAVITGVEEYESKFGPSLRITYTIEGGREVSEIVTMKYTPKTKLGHRVNSLLSTSSTGLPAEIDPEHFEGKVVTITLEAVDGSDYSKVIAVSRRPKDGDEGWE